MEQEACDKFSRALPEHVRLAVAAANPVTLADCVDNFTQMCATLDVDRKEVIPLKPYKARL